MSATHTTVSNLLPTAGGEVGRGGTAWTRFPASCLNHLGSPRRGFPLDRRLDVLVMTEQILWVVLLLQRRQPLVVDTVGCPDLVCSVFFLAPDVVDVDPAGAIEALMPARDPASNGRGTPTLQGRATGRRGSGYRGRRDGRRPCHPVAWRHHSAGRTAGIGGRGRWQSVRPRCRWHRH